MYVKGESEQDSNDPEMSVCTKQTASETFGTH